MFSSIDHVVGDDEGAFTAATYGVGRGSQYSSKINCHIAIGFMFHRTLINYAYGIFFREEVSRGEISPQGKMGES